jgi:hypothetical protein
VCATVLYFICTLLDGAAFLCLAAAANIITSRDCPPLVLAVAAVVLALDGSFNARAAAAAAAAAVAAAAATAADVGLHGCCIELTAPALLLALLVASVLIGDGAVL